MNFYFFFKFRKSNILYNRIAITLMKFYMLYKMRDNPLNNLIFSIYEAELFHDIFIKTQHHDGQLFSHICFALMTRLPFLASTFRQRIDRSIKRILAEFALFRKIKGEGKKSPLRSSRETLRLLFVASRAEYHPLRDIFTRTRERMYK